MQQSPANGEVTSLTGELDTANGNVTRLEGELMTAQGEVTRLTGELMTSQGNASDLQTQLTAAQGEVTRLTGELGTANGEVTRLTGELADAETDRDTYKGMVADAETKIEDDERAARAKAVATAIGGNRVGEGRARIDAAGEALADDAIQLPFLTANTATAAEHGVSATRNSAGEVKVSLAPATLKFTGGEATADADSPWTSAMLTRRMGGDTARKTDDATQDVVVYTDVGAPTPTALATEFVADMTHVAINTDPRRGMVVPKSAPDVGESSFQYAGDHEFDGTYRGVSGTFTCGTAGCGVTTDADGKVSVTGESEFTPDSITATYDEADASYVYFGWWLHKPDGNTRTHMVEAFAGGNQPSEAVTDVTGTATYMGPAAGKYVTKSFTAGDLTDAQVGHFDATATLTANFDPALAGDVPENSIVGSVTDFEQDGESLGNWTVTLAGNAANDQGVVEANITDGNFNGLTNVNFGGATTMGAGKWQGSFYGALGTPAAAPGAAAGTFDARVGDSGYVTGAFGATKQPASN